MQGFAIIRGEEETVITQIKDLAPKFLWETNVHALENNQKKEEQVLICRKKFWSIL